MIFQGTAQYKVATFIAKQPSSNSEMAFPINDSRQSDNRFQQAMFFTLGVFSVYSIINFLESLV